MIAPLPRLRPVLLVLASLVFLAGCRTDLYTNLEEREANEMLSVLMDEGIQATKSTLGDSLFTVTVSNDDVGDALAVLDAQGLPQRARQSLGQVFARSGIVSSPFEERVRYIYALSEEVAQTLQQIDGVLVARVHIVMPEEAELGRETRPASAAVFIKQKLGFDLDFLMPQIRRLVANSIEGLAYEDVTVVLVEAQRQAVSMREPGQTLYEPIPGVRVSASTVPLVWGAVSAFGALVLALIGLLAWALRRRASRGLDDAENAGP